MPGYVTITPIYWEPQGDFNASSYRNIVNQYLGDVAAGSGSNTNVYSTATEYPGSNGSVTYNIALGTPIRDHDPLPKGQGCSVGKLDTSEIYADGSGYTACLDDAQITAEIQNVITALGLPSDYNHEYVMLTPKHVASCFDPGSTANKKNVCTLTTTRARATAPTTPCSARTIRSPARCTRTCRTRSTSRPSGSRAAPTGGSWDDRVAELPGDPVDKDADVEVSPLSHEIMESITDPNTYNGWFDAIGNENGDDCAYVYGNGTWTDLGGTPGMFYNQTINGDHYITQEEFSNADWFNSNGTGGCVRSESVVSPAP